MENILFFLTISIQISAYSQSANTVSGQNRVFQLGEVTVKGSLIDSNSVQSIQKIERFNRIDLSNSLNLLPGISLANIGPQNESVVYVRGFDLRQVPVFMDGVPVYAPYDGYVDLGRFTIPEDNPMRVEGAHLDRMLFLGKPSLILKDKIILFI